MSKVLVALLLLAIAFASTSNLQKQVGSAMSYIAKVKGDCVEDHCPDQIAACDQKCQDALEICSNLCNLSASCWSYCISGKGSQPAIDLIKCALANGCLTQPTEKAF